MTEVLVVICVERVERASGVMEGGQQLLRPGFCPLSGMATYAVLPSSHHLGRPCAGVSRDYDSNIPRTNQRGELYSDTLVHTPLTLFLGHFEAGLSAGEGIEVPVWYTSWQ